MAQVKSRFNGLIVNIPSDARGIVGRFQTQGGNELIFEQDARKRAAPEEPVKIESQAPDPGAKDSGNAHEADIA